MRSAKEYKAIREEIYRFIGAYITKHVYAPSNKEIAEAVGISGTTVHRHLIDMIDGRTRTGISSLDFLEIYLNFSVTFRSVGTEPPESRCVGHIPKI